MKGWLKKFLDKLAKTNEQTFKGQRMDCCSLNKNNTPGLTNQNKK